MPKRKAGPGLFVSFSCLFFCQPAVAGLEKYAFTEKSVAKPVPEAAADRDWLELESIPAKRKDSKDVAAPRLNWAKQIEKAKEFQKKYPNDKRAISARKLELLGTLHSERDKGKLTASTQNLVGAFLADKALPSGERFEVSAAAKSHELKRLSKKGGNDPRSWRAKHAEELINEFPDDPRGYGYLLSVATVGRNPDGKNLAAKLVNAPGTPEESREKARRFIAQQNLIGSKLPNPQTVDLSASQGHLSIVYSWSAQKPGILTLAKELADKESVRVVGINFDKDPSAARALLGVLKTPGQHVFEPEGLNGPLARWLCLTEVGCIYLINGNGTLVDVYTHVPSKEKIMASLRRKEGRP